jgi:hypothetical protein
MDFKGAASKEATALQARQQYLTTLATERCAQPGSDATDNASDRKLLHMDDSGTRHPDHHPGKRAAHTSGGIPQLHSRKQSQQSGWPTRQARGCLEDPFSRLGAETAPPPYEGPNHIKTRLGCFVLNKLFAEACACVGALERAEILCTVPGLTPKRLAITRTPSLPDSFRDFSGVRFFYRSGSERKVAR